MKLSPYYIEWELIPESMRMTVISMLTSTLQNTKIRIQIDIKKYCDAIKTDKTCPNFNVSEWCKQNDL